MYRRMFIGAVLAVAGAAHAAPIDRTLYAIALDPFVADTQALIRFDPDSPADVEYIGNLGFAPGTGVGGFITYLPNTNAFMAGNSTSILTVDRTTGNATSLGAHGVNRVQGFAWAQPYAQTFVAYSLPTDPMHSTGSILDRRIGSVNPDGSITPVFDYTGVLTDIQDFDELVFDGASGHLFAYDAQGATYWEIDPADGSFIASGALPDAPEVFRADINPANGLLYTNEFERDTPAGPLLGQLDIYQRSLVDQTNLGTTGTVGLVDRIDGLAFVPAPGPAGIVMFAGLAAIRRRR